MVDDNEEELDETTEPEMENRENQTEEELNNERKIAGKGRKVDVSNVKKTIRCDLLLRIELVDVNTLHEL